MFRFGLALELGMTVKQLDTTMSMVELHQWSQYFVQKDNESKGMNLGNDAQSMFDSFAAIATPLGG